MEDLAPRGGLWPRVCTQCSARAASESTVAFTACPCLSPRQSCAVLLFCAAVCVPVSALAKVCRGLWSSVLFMQRCSRSLLLEELVSPKDVAQEGIELARAHLVCVLPVKGRSGPLWGLL